MIHGCNDPRGGCRVPRGGCTVPRGQFRGLRHSNSNIQLAV